MEKIITFLHSGDIGDCIAGLGATKEICEKENAKAYFLLDTSGGMTCNDEEINNAVIANTRGKGLKFNNAGYDFLAPLIESQPYIKKVEKFNPNVPISIDYNLNSFRKAFLNREVAKATNQNLLFLHQNAVGLDFKWNGPWLSFNEETEEKHKILISRSPRVHSAYAFFAIHEDMLKENAEFIGTDFEYELFKETFRYQPQRWPVKTAYDCLRAIATSEVVICNSTMFYWIAVGFGHKNIIHEMPIDVPTSYFPNQTPNFIHYLQGAHFIA